MSLINQALVIATAYTLKNKTAALNRISRQPVDPVNDLLRDENANQQPVLAVYVESSSAEVAGKATQGNSTRIVLKIYAYISPGKTRIESEGEDGLLEFTLDGDRAGLTLDIIGRQVDAALHPAQHDDWAAVWHKMVVRVASRDVHYVLYEIENGIRIPAMEISYELTAIPDPNFVGEPTIAWQMFFAALRLTTEGAQLADLFESLMKDPANVPDYMALQANYGLTPEAAAATGLYPVDIASVTNPGAQTPGLVDVGLDGEIVIVPEEEP